MEKTQNYIILQNGYTLSYDETQCYENDKEYQSNDSDKREPNEIIKELKHKFYNAFFKKHFRNLIFLTAAGTSLNNGENSGKTREDLWNECKDEISSLEKKDKNVSSKPFFIEKDIEGLLSYIILYEKIHGDLIINKNELLKAKIEKKISETCKLVLSETAPHKEFLNKITARKPSEPRIKLFTTNYDTLFEQAANEAGFIIIDGFSYTQPRRFSGRYFDIDIVNREKTRIKQEESFLSKVFHLYKLHGSVNWTKENNTILLKENPTNPLIIYPASEKYESSYEQPYFEMMSRFQSSLRQENTLLIVIGFGFKDKHIQNVIIEAVEQNPSFQLVIINYSNSNSIQTTNLESFFLNVDAMKVKRNVTIIFDNFSGFVDNYPSNLTYIEQQKDNNNESIQP